MSRDLRVPWGAKGLAALVLAYALSPIDLIPDFIPLRGLLDDLILVPLGIWLVLRLVPRSVWLECRKRARVDSGRLPPNRWAGLVIVTLWLLTALWRWFGPAILI